MRLTCLFILIVAGQAFGQADFDSAYAKLKAKQQRPATPSTQPDRPTLVKQMEELIIKADGVVDVYTKGLTTAQKKASDDKIAEQLATLCGELEGNRVAAKVIVTDVLNMEGAYVAVGEIAIPSPSQLQKDQASNIREINRAHDERVRQAKAVRATKTDDAAAEINMTYEIRNADAERAKFLDLIKHDKGNLNLRATVYLVGGPELLSWGKQDIKSIDVITLDKIKLNTRTLKPTTASDLDYIGHASVFAAIGPIRKTMNWDDLEKFFVQSSANPVVKH